MVFRPWSLEGRRINACALHDAIPQMEAGMLWHPSVPLADPARALQQFLIHACGS
jgi:hypothetical protein